MIESGQVQATVGVSCLSVLERVFPYMEAAAIPGIAIPLLRDGCKDTFFDEDWLTEVLEVFEDDQQSPVNLTRLKQSVQDWFEPDVLKDYFTDIDNQAARLALEWMSEEGKRYRPMLAAGVYATLTSTKVEAMPQTVQQAAIAVECFHKASLIHDDIEDGDEKRYQRQTLHIQYGVPVALNTGDYLIGLGYELLSHMACSDAQKANILQVASEGHRQLCRGQGAELESMAAQKILPEEKMIEIFAQKTSPAFAVALKIGAILADTDAALLKALDAYSETLGIAYQIRDDLHDRQSGALQKSFSIIASMAADSNEDCAVRRAEKLLGDFRRQAIESLEAVRQSDCKAFLRKVITKIFDGDEQMECCDEYTSKSD
ncbi:MAG: polyprenyl synthetase family protein [Phycisphaerae bacterium]|nr:polyprenyl synthetase family protein [Phycisphaerae bacterium]